MKLSVHVIGERRVRDALQARRRHHGEGFEEGIKLAAVYLQGESQRLVPVDTGDLRRSAITRAEGTGLKMVAFVGYTQSYAVYVHENPYAHHPVGRYKFLEEPARTKRKQIIAIVFKAMR